MKITFLHVFYISCKGVCGGGRGGGEIPFLHVFYITCMGGGSGEIAFLHVFFTFHVGGEGLAEIDM